MHGRVSGASTAALIFGVLSIVAWILPLVGYPITIGGLVLGIVGYNSDHSSRAMIGIVLSVVFLIATIASSIYGIYMVTH